MEKSTNQYIGSISEKFSREETSEYGYRTPFETLIKEIFSTIKVQGVDHDAKAKGGNKPDFAVIKNKVPILYIETKDIGVSLDKIEKSEQMARYYGYANLVLTDYLEFRFYRNGKPYEQPIKIAEYDLKARTITPIPENYEQLTATLIDFAQSHKEPIKSGQHLAKIMGGKAQRIRDNVLHIFSLDTDEKDDLEKLYYAIKELLVHDLTEETFADMYAQTLVYGLFVARYYDKTPGNFSRQEARELIPNSNPLLRRFFDHIVGADFDSRLKFIVDELCEVYSHADVQSLMEQYFKNGKGSKAKEGSDPVIHFYEDFLEEYDPVLRKKMGAYYTPQPVVDFIVKSVDYLLKKEFGLSEGLVDTTKTKDGQHKVQILDPACGTGTFISAVIREIYLHLKKNGQEGRWTSYVHHDLLPRIYGFELMMAPYTIAHLKLGIAFRQTGFWDFHRRLGIYLTNSLENSLPAKDLFSIGLAESIAEEAKEASKIKNEKPIMVVIGNPPYSVSSSNKGEWIQEQIKVYKKDLNEKKINLDDDYIKFIRFAEHFIERNGSGIVAMITNNSFVDGVTHRQMRKHLIETFDDIYIFNLHGNSKKKEVAPDGGKDENVFNIQQGVSINLFIKKKSTIGDKNIYSADIYGERNHKFDVLSRGTIEDIKWTKLTSLEPYYFFVPKDFSLEEEYRKGFSVDELFLQGSSGIETLKDSLVINTDEGALKVMIQDLQEGEYEKYLSLAKKKHLMLCLKDKNLSVARVERLFYRPFDYRYVIYTETSGGVLHRPRYKIMKNLLRPNLALGFSRTVYGHFDWQDAIVTDSIAEKGFMAMRIGNAAKIYPLYIYSTDDSRSVNLNEEIVRKIEENVDATQPEEVLDYIYAIVYSPKFREKYKEFLKIDFPRIPYPKDKKSFKKLVALGKELRELHLMESTKLCKFITTYPKDGSNVVEKWEYKDGNVYINEEQYFGKVPELAWNFYIGGYQPAQKWLKDRKGRVLMNEDIEHYQKIIRVLIETGKIMKKIDS